MTAIACASMFAAVLVASEDEASAATCVQIGSRLASQNSAVKQMLRRSRYCMQQVAHHAASLESRTETEWTGLCEAGEKSTYDDLVGNRDQMLRACTPRGSSN